MPGPLVEVSERAPRPASADHDARGRQLILGLHDGDGVFALVILSQAAIADDAIDEAGRRRDGIPGHHIDAAEDSAQRARFVAGHDDLAVCAVHVFKAVGIGVLTILSAVQS